jgi:hypothetical protein
MAHSGLAEMQSFRSDSKTPVLPDSHKGFQEIQINRGHIDMFRHGSLEVADVYGSALMESSEGPATSMQSKLSNDKFFLSLD